VFYFFFPARFTAFFAPPAFLPAFFLVVPFGLPRPLVALAKTETKNV